MVRDHEEKLRRDLIEQIDKQREVNDSKRNQQPSIIVIVDLRHVTI